MDATIIAALVLFLAFIIFDARRRTAQQLRLIAEEKSGIAVASGMTASIGVFYPDVRTTVVMGASEDTGICYYRVLRDGKVINRSKISLGNIDRVDLLVNGTALSAASELLPGHELSQGYGCGRPLYEPVFASPVAGRATRRAASGLSGRRRRAEGPGHHRAAYGR